MSSNDHGAADLEAAEGLGDYLGGVIVGHAHDLTNRSTWVGQGAGEVEDGPSAGHFSHWRHGRDGGVHLPRK